MKADAKQETKPMNITQKLAYIQTKLKAPKSNRNDFGKYRYRSCEDILEAVKPLLAEVNAVLKLTDTVEQIGDRYYIKATAELWDADDPTRFESVCAYAREADAKKGMDVSQVTGAASSYARKYALNGLFCIDDTKDADTMNNNDDPIAKLDAIEEVDITKIKPRTKSKFETIRDQIGDQMFDDLMADFGAEDMTQLESLADAKKEAFYASAREAYKTIKRGE